MQTDVELFMPATHEARPTCAVDDTAWVDWVAANTPARPAEDAASLDEVQDACRRLSHPTWNAEVDEASGRWRLRTDNNWEGTTIYLQKCSMAVFEGRLLSLRRPDGRSILDAQQANSIAAEYEKLFAKLMK